jgi:CARDB
MADLTVSALSAPSATAAGTGLTISDTIRNTGGANAGGFSIGYNLDGPSGRTTLATHTSGGLAANGSSLESFSVTLPDTLAPATYTLTVQANTSGSVTESNTGNNTATSSLSVTTAGGGSSSGSGGSGSGSGVSGSGSGGSGTYRSDSAMIPVPTAARPLFHVPFLEPTFGTTLTRMTDASMAPSASWSTTVGLRHEYARFPVLNATNTKMVVAVIGGEDEGLYEVRDLASGALHYKLGAWGGDPEISWHSSLPEQLLYRTGNAVHVFHTDTGQDDTLMAFPQYYAISARGEGRPSDDWHYYAFLGFRDSSYTNPDIVVADLVAKKVVTTWASGGDPDWVSMSPSGKYVVVQWMDGQGTLVYDRDTLAYRSTAFSDHSHSDFAFNAAGEEVIVYQASSGAAVSELSCPNPPNGSPIASARLADGQKKILLGDCYDANWQPVVAGASLGWNWFTPHFSGIASRAHPGWVLVSTYTRPGSPQQPFAREVFWLKLDGSGAVRRRPITTPTRTRPTARRTTGPSRTPPVRGTGRW